MPIQIYTQQISPRLGYVAEIVFGCVLGVAYKCVEVDGVSAECEGACIAYGFELEGALHVPKNGLLEQTGLEEPRMRLEYRDLPYLFWKDGNSEIQYDIFSAIFFLITEYEKQAIPLYDQHDRYDEKAYLAYMQAWHQKPLVDLYALELLEELRVKFPRLPAQQKEFDYRLTLDIDFPWKYLKKPLWVQGGSFFKQILKRKWDEISEQIRSFISQKDPYFTFDLIQKICPPEKTILFFLLARNHTLDSRFTASLPALRELIQDFSDKGYGVGIHPSYNSFLDREMMQKEINLLSQIIQKPVQSSRQHFLRYRLPQTFRHLLDAGITEDYSLCMYSDIGFRTYIARPYPWFDLSQNVQTKLILHPTMVMDRSLQHYLKLKPEEGLAKVQALIAQVQAVRGEFCMLIHNDALSESGEWKGWKQPLLDVIKGLGLLLK